MEEAGAIDLRHEGTLVILIQLRIFTEYLVSCSI